MGQNVTICDSPYSLHCHIVSFPHLIVWWLSCELWRYISEVWQDHRAHLEAMYFFFCLARSYGLDYSLLVKCFYSLGIKVWYWLIIISYSRGNCPLHGAIGLILAVILLTFFADGDENQSDFITDRSTQFTDMVLSLFLLIWFGFGNYWTWKIFKPNFTRKLHTPSDWWVDSFHCFLGIHSQCQLQL